MLFENSGQSAILGCAALILDAWLRRPVVTNGNNYKKKTDLKTHNLALHTLAFRQFPAIGSLRLVSLEVKFLRSSFAVFALVFIAAVVIDLRRVAPFT